jgi:hypothetical protein
MSFVDYSVDKLFKNKPADYEAFTRDFGRVKADVYRDNLETRQNLGRAKGNISHATVRAAITFDPAAAQKIDSEIERMYDKSGIIQGKYGWIAKNIAIIMGRIGVNLFDDTAEFKDEVFAEVKTAHNILGLGGAIDLLVRHPEDNTYSVYDFKTTSNFFKGSRFASMLKFGGQGIGKDIIRDDLQSRAKLQIMLYALTLKLNNPDMKFRNLKGVWLENESVLKSKHLSVDVQANAYLAMIQDYLKNEEPDKWEALKNSMSKEDFAKIWRASDYMAGYDHETHKQIKTTNDGLEGTIKKTVEEIRHAVYHDLTANEFTADEESRSRVKEAAEKMQQYVDLIKGDFQSIQYWDDEQMSIVGSQLHSGATANSSLFQYYNQLKTEHKNKAESRYLQKKKIFDRLIKPIKQAYLERKGKAGWDKLTGGGFTKINYDDFYSFAYTKRYVDVKDTNGNVIGKVEKGEKLRTTDKEWEELINDPKHDWINSTNVKMYRDFVDFVNETYGEFFKGKDALANKKATWVKGRGNETK